MLCNAFGAWLFVKECARCWALEERVADLEDQLGIERERVEKRVLLAAFGLTQTEVWYLLALWRAKGRVVDPYWLLDNRPIRSLDEDKQSNPLNVVRVYMFKLRRKVGAECFESMRDEGYMLTPAGLAKIRKVISFGGDYEQG